MFDSGPHESYTHLGKRTQLDSRPYTASIHLQNAQINQIPTVIGTAHDKTNTHTHTHNIAAVFFFSTLFTHSAHSTILLPEQQFQQHTHARRHTLIDCGEWLTSSTWSRAKPFSPPPPSSVWALHFTSLHSSSTMEAFQSFKLAVITAKGKE